MCSSDLAHVAYGLYSGNNVTYVARFKSSRRLVLDLKNSYLFHLVGFELRIDISRLRKVVDIRKSELPAELVVLIIDFLLLLTQPK